MHNKILMLFSIITLIFGFNNLNVFCEFTEKLPTVLIATTIRNKAHTLPYFFSYLENLDYPKSRLSLWIRSDHNEDNSIEITKIWLNRTSHLYHHVDFEHSENPIRYRNEASTSNWTETRFLHIINLRENALQKAKDLWADYIFFVDADVYLANSTTLTELVSFNLPIVAPMLKSQSLFSNYWCGMSKNYYYQRTDDYKEIYEFKMIGNIEVPMVHTAILIDLRFEDTDRLTFNRDKLIQNQIDYNWTERIYDGPNDDIIIFAISANSSGLPMYISNKYIYGYMMEPLEPNENIDEDLRKLKNIRVKIITDFGTEVLSNKEFEKFVPAAPQKHKLSLDHIYMINLERRPERKVTMELIFDELGLDVEHFPAVDGRKLNEDILAEMGVKLLSSYADPYHNRKMKMGEIGCFLSHYKIWEKMVELNQKEVLVLEDDIRFEPYFIEQAQNVLDQARNFGQWDLLYFGRKRLEYEDEPYVAGTTNIVHVSYSYWTLAYVLTLEGAKKLLDVKPLEKLIPVDEFLPVMFDRHPNGTWNSEFQIRNLFAFSAEPLLLYPILYYGEDGYISDTEFSELIAPLENDNIVSEKQLRSTKEHDPMNHEFNENYKSIVREHFSKRDISEL